MSNPNSDPEIEEEDEIIDLPNNSIAYFEHEDSIYLIASHPTLPLVLTGGGDDVAYIWSTVHSPPQVVWKLDKFNESVVAGGFSSDGSLCVAGDMNGNVNVWVLKDDKCEFLAGTKEVNEVVSIAFHPTKNIIAVCGRDSSEPDAAGSVWVYEYDNNAINVPCVISLHSAPVNQALFVPTPDSDRLLTFDESGTVLLTDIYTQQTIFNVNLSLTFVSGCLSPTKNSAALASFEGELVIIRLDNGQCLQRVAVSTSKDPEANSIEGLAWSDKNLVVTGNVAGEIKIFDISTWRPRNSIQLGDSITKIEFVPKSTLFTVSSMDGTLNQYDALNAQPVFECVGHNEGVLGFTVQDEGHKIISAGDDFVSLVFVKP